MLGQDAKSRETPPGKLEHLGWLCGDWTASFPPDAGQVGTLKARFYWLCEGQFLRAETRLLVAGSPVYFKEDTWYWDPVGQVVRKIQFASKGEWLQGEVYVTSGDVGKSFRSYDQGITDLDRGNVAFSRSVIVTKTGNDSWTYREVGIAIALTADELDRGPISFQRDPVAEVGAG